VTAQPAVAASAYLDPHDFQNNMGRRPANESPGGYSIPELMFFREDQ
jgi:hypothetical protein